jgi:hypothetical protein
MDKTENLKPFQKGVSGNPNGRPKIPPHVREMARGLTEEAINTAAEIMRNAEETGTARMSAVNTILDRAWGKAPQAMTGEDGEGPVQLAVTFSDLDRAKALAALMARMKAQGQG